MKRRLFASFSGGRTSAYMTHLALREFAATHEIVVGFANTGQEHPRTLEFINECDKRLGFGTVWLEPVIQPESGVGTTHRVVTFDTACRDGSLFESMIGKFGIPNKGYPHCTRELKQRPMTSYLRSIGWEAGSYVTALGIRADEIDRMAHDADAKGLIYPLVKRGITKADILTWWSKQPFDLQIREHQGNCVWCWKKSLRKHLTLISESPEIYDFPRRMERDYAMARPERGSQSFFRGGMNTDQLFTRAAKAFVPFMESDEHRQSTMMLEMDASNGCDESCEVETA